MNPSDAKKRNIGLVDFCVRVKQIGMENDLI